MMTSGPAQLTAYHLTVQNAQKAKPMTKHEASALQELGMTEEQLKERQRDLELKLAANLPATTDALIAEGALLGNGAPVTTAP